MRQGIRSLPSPSTSLIGRASELTAARQLLLREGVRLVTFTGPGGVGKTRLAIEVARQLAREFEDGVTFVSLAPIRDAALVLPAIAQALELKDAGGSSADERDEHLFQYLRDKHALLVLDNFEQVLAASTQIAQCLAKCPQVKLLITSRAVLRIGGEYEFAVPSLGLTQANGDDAPAITLFVERACAVAPDFSLTDANAPTVHQICARVDALPLAIELAAARIKLLTPEALLARLSHRMDVLTAGARDLPMRQQTLRNTIQWSYDLLDEDARRAFRQLSLFVGSFSLEAAEAIGVMLDAVSALQDWSLVRRADVAANEPRFLMLETLREFAHEQLGQHGEGDAVERAHAAHFLALAEQAEPHLTGGEQSRWLARLEADLPNFRAALHSVIARGDAETALRLSSALWRFWLLHGHLIEGVRWLEAALAVRGDTIAASLFARARALNAAGYLASNLGNYEQAEALCGEAERLARKLGNERIRATATQVVASSLTWRGQYARAIAIYDEAIGILRALDDQPNLAFTLLFKGNAHWFAGDYQSPTPLFAEAMAIFKALDMQSGIGFVLYEMGFVSSIRGEASTARRCYGEAYEILHAIGDRRGLIRAYLGLARVALDEGDAVPARAHSDEALALAMELGERWSIAAALDFQAAVLTTQGQPEMARAAAQLCGAAEALRERIGAPQPVPLREWQTRDLAAARTRLGEGAFAAAWAAGRGLSPEQAAALIEAHKLNRSADPSPKTGAQSLPQPLSPRETEVLRLLAQGMTDAHIAEALVISTRTVHAHLNSIYNKLGVSNRSAATRWAVMNGLG